MARTELGVKRRCLSCTTAFFDLNRNPILCPKCSAVFQVIELAYSSPRTPRARPAPFMAYAAPAPEAADEVLLVEEEDEAVAEEAEDADETAEPIEEAAELEIG